MTVPSPRLLTPLGTAFGTLPFYWNGTMERSGKNRVVPWNGQWNDRLTVPPFHTYSVEQMERPIGLGTNYWPKWRAHPRLFHGSY